MISIDTLKFLQETAYEAAYAAAEKGEDAFDAAQLAVFELIVAEEGALTGYAIAAWIAEAFAAEAIDAVRQTRDDEEDA